MKEKKSNYITQLIEKEEELSIELKKIRKLFSLKEMDEKGIFTLFKKVISKYPSNHEVLKCFLDFLQLLNENDLVVSFSLEDISRLYKKMCTRNKFDLELNLDFFYYIYNVLDNEAESLKLYQKYKKDILSSFNKFEERTGS